MPNMNGFRLVPCPTCGAAKQEPCQRDGKPIDTICGMRVRDTLLTKLKGISVD
jgi:hypothetical protein